MKIWKLTDPRDYNFAWFEGEATWEKVNDRKGLCPECTSGPDEIRLPGLKILWKAGSDIIGDFVWSEGGGWVLAVERVCDDLGRHFKGFEPVSVEMVDHPKLHRPTRPTRRTKPRIWLPYTGPNLHEIWVTKKVNMDPEHTTAELETDCHTCGYRFYNLIGSEIISVDYNPVRKDLDYIHTPRRSGQGLFVREADLEGADFFGVYELIGDILCTDRVRDFILEQGYNNIAFLEMGDVI